MVCAAAVANAQGIAFTEAETDSLARFKRKYYMLEDDELFPAALAVLKETAQEVKPKNEIVLGAMLWFEKAAAEGKTPDGYIQPLEKGIIPSNLRVLFSTITKIKQLQYIPVKEELIVSEIASNIALVSYLGPFKFCFDGAYKTSGEFSFDFQFTESTIEFFGKVIRQSSMSGTPKTYTYVLNHGDGVAVARSSGGGLTLCMHPSLFKKKEWKPDFLATKL